jgi:hypothetical protein
MDAARVEFYGHGASSRGIDEACTVDRRRGEAMRDRCLGHARAPCRSLRRRRASRADAAVEDDNASALARASV